MKEYRQLSNSIDSAMACLNLTGYTYTMFFSDLKKGLSLRTSKGSEIMNIGDYIVKEDDRVYIQTEEEFNKSIKPDASTQLDNS